MAERWRALAEDWTAAEQAEARGGLADEARALAREAGGPTAFSEAVRRSGAEGAEVLLTLCADARAEELADALKKLFGRPLASSAALRAAETLAALGVELDEADAHGLAKGLEVAAELADTLNATGEPETIVQAAEPLKAFNQDDAVSVLMEVFARTDADGWLRASRLVDLSDPLDAAIASALEEASLPGAEAVPLIKRLALSEAKTTAKKARSLLHKLKSRGVDIEEAEGPAVWKPPAVEVETGEALVTGFDQAGNRSLVLALPAPGRGFHVGLGLISDSDGLLNFSWGPMVKKQLAELTSEIAEEHRERRISIAPVEPDEAALRLSAAAALSEARGREVPEDYRSFAGRHPPPKGEPKALVYEVMPPETVERARHSMSASPTLLDDPMGAVTFWRIEAEAVARAVEPADERRIIVAPTAPKAAGSGKPGDACDSLFYGDVFERLLARLEEQAYVYWTDGQPDYATLCLACVLPFRDDPLLKPSGHPFWKLWAERLVALHLEEARREKAEGRLIVTPEEAAAEAAAARRRFRPGSPRRR